jgi:hypothetical protein
MSAEHTPGPWQVTESGNVAGPTRSFGSQGWVGRICLANVMTGDVEVKAANARLIAAAPDLLAACEEALDEDSGLACAGQLRAAIAKARGGA